jgi:two-component system CheB/CheR fusion protein
VGESRIGKDQSTAWVTEIAALLLARLGHDFTHYKKGTMIRRIRRRMQACCLDAPADYIKYVKEQPVELDALFRDLLIGVTGFFRDPEAFDALREQVVSPLLDQRNEIDDIRIWVPACANGEEVYSLAILFAEEMEKRGRKQSVQIFATDIDDRAIKQARSGRYRLPSPGLSQERAAKWFTSNGDIYAAIPTIRDMCTFSIHDVLRDAPFSKLDLISCRNLLIYFEPQLQVRALRNFHYALRPNGALFLGASEGVNRDREFFASIDKKHRLFRRCENVASRPETPHRFRPLHSPLSSKAVTLPQAPSARDDHFERSALRALEGFSPAYVIVDQKNDIRRFSGSEAGRFLETSSGHASLNLFTLLRKPLRPAVRAALATMSKTRETVVHDRVAIKIGGESKSVKIIVAPLADDGAQERYTVVAFQEMNAAAPPKDLMSSDEMLRANIQLLEDELFTIKAQLEATVSEYQVVSEEMHAANEEYQSTNEELQSSNEELETNKEEMQSVNEELQTVNSELIGKNELLIRVNSDLKNVLESTDIPTIFLDNDLRIKSFTPGMTEIFHLRDSDCERPIGDIATLLNYTDVPSDAADVLRSLTPRERKVENAKTGAAYIMRIRPYRRVDNLLDGVVVTFVDVTEVRQAEAALRESEQKFRQVADEIPHLVWITQANGYVDWFNQRWHEYTGTTLEQMEGWGWKSVVDPSVLPSVLEAWTRTIAIGEPFDMTFPLRGADGKFRPFLTRVTPLKDAEGKVVQWFGTNTEVSEQKALEEALRRAMAKAQQETAKALRADQAKSKFLAAASHDLRQPVQSLILLMGVIKRQAKDRPQIDQAVDLALASVNSLNELLTGLLDISRLDAGVIQPVMSSVDLGEIVSRLAREYQPRAAAAGLALRCRRRAFHTRTDATLLERILRNLLENALRFTAKGGVLIGLRQRGDKVRIDVIDTGIGIPADKQSEIFEEFRQLDNPARDANLGLGLGLAIVKRLAHLIGAEAQVSSRPGRGARFSLLLPQEQTAPVPVETPSAIDTPGGRILVIEDNATLRMAYEVMLEFSGYEFRSAETGEEALALAAKENWRFDAIVADHRLGAGLTGTETAKEIRRRAGRAIPTLVVTGDTARERLAEVSASGFGILHKPVDTDKLCGTLASLLSGGSSLPPVTTKDQEK